MIICSKIRGVTWRSNIYVPCTIQKSNKRPSSKIAHFYPLNNVYIRISTCVYNIPLEFWPFYNQWKWMKSKEHDQTPCSQAFARWNQEVKTSRMVFKDFSSVEFYWNQNIVCWNTSHWHSRGTNLQNSRVQVHSWQVLPNNQVRGERKTTRFIGAQLRPGCLSILMLLTPLAEVTP